MEEKRYWGLNIGGEIYKVKCVIHDTEYLLYVNKEPVMRTERDAEDPLGQEVHEVVEIGGLLVNFLVENGRVMLVIDGKVMLNMQETREKRMKPAYNSARLQMVLGAAAAAFGAWQYADGQPLDRLWLVLVFGAALFCVGLSQLFKLKRQIKAAEKQEEEEY